MTLLDNASEHKSQEAENDLTEADRKLIAADEKLREKVRLKDEAAAANRLANTPHEQARLRPNEMLDAALRYAAMGIKVHPVHGMTDGGVCTCQQGLDCPKNAGKHPISGKHLVATTDPKQIRKWWDNNPNWNIGIPCATNGLVAVDVDTDQTKGKQGDKTLAEIEAEYGQKFTSTVEQISGSGGRHIIYRSDKAPPGSTGDIDFKWNGYILAAPSRHKSGGRYRFVGGKSFDDVYDDALGLSVDPIAPGQFEAVAVVAARIKATTIEAMAKNAQREGSSLSSEMPGSMTIDELRHILKSIACPAGYDPWNRIGMAVHFASAGSVDGCLLFDEWSSEGPNYTPYIVEHKWSRDYKLDMDGVKGATLRRMAREQDPDFVEYGVKMAREIPASALDARSEEEKAEAAADATVKKPKKVYEPYPYKLASEITAETLRKVCYLVEDLLTDLELAVFAGNPAAGKSSLGLLLAFAVAAGIDFLGRKTKQRSVLYMSAENPDEDERRVVAMAKYYGVPAPKGLAIVPLELRLFYADEDRGKQVEVEERIVATAEALAARSGLKFGLLIYDNLRNAIVPADTADEAAVTKVFGMLRSIKTRLECALAMLHHNVKGEQRYAGSGAIESGADTLLRLEMKEETDEPTTGRALKSKATKTKLKAKSSGRLEGEITFAKRRMGDKRQVIPYELVPISICTDENDKPIYTVVSDRPKGLGRHGASAKTAADLNVSATLDDPELDAKIDVGDAPDGASRGSAPALETPTEVMPETKAEAAKRVQEAARAALIAAIENSGVKLGEWVAVRNLDRDSVPGLFDIVHQVSNLRRSFARTYMQGQSALKVEGGVLEVSDNKPGIPFGVRISPTVKKVT